MSPYKIFLISLGVSLFSACQTDPSSTTSKPEIAHKKSVNVPFLNADSAFSFVQKQVAFGPRVPNSKEHVACAKYLEEELKRLGLETSLQKGQMRRYDGTMLNIQNIMGRLEPQNSKRILLFAHWDSRHIADRDLSKKDQAILGANDGASGVGLILEIMRTIQISNQKPKIGIDVLFVDAEDQGQPGGGSMSDTWCLGTQYWAKNMPWTTNKPQYGILLDMVGARNAQFPKEGNSLKYAPEVVEKVWLAAKQLGYDYHFIAAEDLYGITDDHVYMNTLANIPSIDIIQYNVEAHDFGDFHHRHADNMSVIDKNTLQAVGQTLLQVIYNE